MKVPSSCSSLLRSTRWQTAALALTAISASQIGTAHASTWNLGDVFVGVAGGAYKVYDNTGVFKETITDGLGGFTTGGAFNSTFDKLYTTDFSSSTVVVYDGTGAHTILQNINTALQGGASCESIVFDSSGNFYVGHAGGDANVQKYDSTGTFLATYDVATQNVGSDWIDLAADQTTLFHTSEGQRIMRYDLSTSTQLSDFALLPGAGEGFALRLLPPFDGSGGLIVADGDEIKRLDGSGAVIQTYDAAGEDSWFAMNLDPNGSSFWAADFTTSNFYRFNKATGAIEVGPINTGTGTFTVFGLIVRGEVTGGNAPPTFDPPTPTCGSSLGASVNVPITFTVSASDVTPGDIVTLTASGVPPAATLTPPLPTSGNPVSTTFTWTPTNADVGSTTITFTATDLAGNATSCPITIAVAECLLVVGRGGGNAQVVFGGQLFDTNLYAVRSVFPVTMTDMPTFGVPNFSFQYNFAVEVVMHNPTVFPNNPDQWSNRMRVTIDPGQQVSGTLYGTLNGIHILLSTFNDSFGYPQMRFPFTIDGM